jgi:cobalt-zinc-cadmium efflux system protein
MGHDHHGHSHSHNHSHDLTGNSLLFSIALNVGITVAQVVGGILSGSLALLSDALHNFSDVLSLVISFWAQKIARRPASFKQTFGLKRAELIAAFVNALTLIIVALYLMYEAVTRFMSPVSIEPGIVIWMAILAIAGNGLSVFLLKKDAGRNLNMRSAYLHLLTDMMASVAVLIGGLAMYYFNVLWIDAVLTLCIGIYLVVVGMDLLLKSARVLMLYTPEEIDIEQLIAAVDAIPGVGKLYHIHVWQLDEERLHLEARLDFANDITLSQFSALMPEIEKVLAEKFNITHVTIQPGLNGMGEQGWIVED